MNLGRSEISLMRTKLIALQKELDKIKKENKMLLDLIETIKGELNVKHVETIITHESDEWLSGVTSSPVQRCNE